MPEQRRAAEEAPADFLHTVFTATLPATSKNEPSLLLGATMVCNMQYAPVGAPVSCTNHQKTESKLEREDGIVIKAGRQTQKIRVQFLGSATDSLGQSFNPFLLHKEGEKTGKSHALSCLFKLQDLRGWDCPCTVDGMPSAMISARDN